jgi:hypothetical protein
VLEVVEEQADHLRSQSAIEHHQRGFVVERHRAIVEVHGPDRRPLPIDHERLGMQRGRLPFIDPHAREGFLEQRELTFEFITRALRIAAPIVMGTFHEPMRDLNPVLNDGFKCFYGVRVFWCKTRKKPARCLSRFERAEVFDRLGLDATSRAPSTS